MEKIVGIYGRNGLGVFRNRDKLEDTRYYLVDYQMKEFSTWKEAEIYAATGYNEKLKESGAARGYYPDEKMKENWCYYKKDLMKYKKSDAWSGKIFGI